MCIYTEGEMICVMNNSMFLISLMSENLSFASSSLINLLGFEFVIVWVN